MASKRELKRRVKELKARVALYKRFINDYYINDDGTIDFEKYNVALMVALDATEPKTKK